MARNKKGKVSSDKSGSLKARTTYCFGGVYGPVFYAVQSRYEEDKLVIQTMHTESLYDGTLQLVEDEDHDKVVRRINNGFRS